MISLKGECRPPLTGTQEVHHDFTPSLSAAAADEVRALVDGVLVVVVHLRPKNGDTEPKFRRRIFLTLASAQRHADRAREQGHHARVVLSRLAPVSEVRA